MIPALALILCFQLLGEVLSRGLGLVLPGPVLGMLFLLAALLARPALVERMRIPAQTLLGHMSLFFVPAGVGVVAHLGLLRSYGAELLVALTASTVLAMAASVLAFRLVARLVGTRDD